MFRKVMGDPPVGQIAFTFSIIGFLNAAILWPICIALYFTGAEVMPWETLPWIVLLMASILLLGEHPRPSPTLIDGMLDSFKYDLSFFSPLSWFRSFPHLDAVQ